MVAQPGKIHLLHTTPMAMYTALPRCANDDATDDVIILENSYDNDVTMVIIRHSWACCDLWKPPPDGYKRASRSCQPSDLALLPVRLL